MDALLKKYMALVHSECHRTFVEKGDFSEAEQKQLDEVRAQLYSGDWQQGRASLLLHGDGWKVSFKTPDMFITEKSEVCETALIDTRGRAEYYILYGDYRTEFEGSPLRAFEEMKAIYDRLR